MCDERDRLLDYLYDACDAQERRQVETHLAGCEICREEIAGLRSVRQDLLAWHVPDHGSVWKPFVQVRVTPWWREVPAWAFAAAASIMFLIGVAGGVVAVKLTDAPVQTASAAAVPTLTPAPILTAENQRAMEQRIAGAVQARMAPLAAHAPGLSTEQMRVQVAGLVGESEARQRQELTNLWKMMDQDAQKMYVRRTEFNAFKTDFNALNSYLDQRIMAAVTQALQQQGGR